MKGKSYVADISAVVLHDRAGRRVHALPMGAASEASADFRARAVQLPASALWWIAVTDPQQETLQSADAASPLDRCMRLVTPPQALCAYERDPQSVLAATAADGMRAHVRGVPPKASPTWAPTPNVRFILRHGTLDKGT